MTLRLNLLGIFLVETEDSFQAEKKSKYFE